MNMYFKVRCVLYYSTLITIIALIFLYNTSEELKEFEDIPLKIMSGETSTFFTFKPTKSMSDLGEMDQINSYALFLNQIPNCGGEFLIFLLQKLQGFNNFRHVRFKRGSQLLSTYDQDELVSRVYSKMREEAVPLSFDRSVYLINFTEFDRQFPTFVNIIRDPIEKLSSRSNFGKDSSLLKCIHTKRKCSVLDEIDEFTIPYFCGQDPSCRSGNSEWALQIAKNNVEKFYPVVGLLEDLNSTITVLENRIPYFFKGARQIYAKKFTANLSILKTNMDERKRIILKNILRTEYEFYEWIKRRLAKQMNEILE